MKWRWNFLKNIKQKELEKLYDEVEQRQANIAAGYAAGKWRPINTAPRDGTEILVYFKNLKIPSKVAIAVWSEICKDWIEAGSGDALLPPTHWAEIYQ